MLKLNSQEKSFLSWLINLFKADTDKTKWYSRENLKASKIVSKGIKYIIYIYISLSQQVFSSTEQIIVSNEPNKNIKHE